MDRGAKGRNVIRVCLHGAESTGKSALAKRLEVDCGWPWVAEYGREYAEAHGTRFTMADLVAMARGQAERTERAAALAPPVLIIDTDPLMTAAWAQMLFDDVPAELLAYPKADLYLLFAPDVPWQADGTRFFGTAELRARFAAVAEAMLVRCKVRWERVSGDWPTREAMARAAIVRAQNP
jgi:NadR type nicotinamide-nucleotide adenylyltransferase